MTNNEAYAKAQQLWGHEGRHGWVAFDSRQDPEYMVGENTVTLGTGSTWEKAFENSENKP